MPSLYKLFRNFAISNHSSCQSHTNNITKASSRISCFYCLFAKKILYFLVIYTPQVIRQVNQIFNVWNKKKSTVYFCVLGPWTIFLLTAFGTEMTIQRCDLRESKWLFQLTPSPSFGVTIFLFCLLGPWGNLDYRKSWEYTNFVVYYTNNKPIQFLTHKFIW